MPSMDEEDDVRRFLVRGTGAQLADNKSLKDMLDDIEGSGFATGTDSLKVLSDVLDAIEGSGFSTTTDSLKVLSDVLDLIRTELTFQHQAPIVFNQASPEQNKWYTVLDTTLKARLYFLELIVADTGETLEVRITIDGQVYTGSVAATAGSSYYAYMSTRATLTLGTLENMVAKYESLEGRSIKIEMRKTTANGTGTLSARGNYATR